MQQRPETRNNKRVQVEITWFIALSNAGFAEFPALSAQDRDYLLQRVANFSEADAQACPTP